MLDKLAKAGIIRKGETILHSDQGWQYQHKLYLRGSQTTG